MFELSHKLVAMGEKQKIAIRKKKKSTFSITTYKKREVACMHSQHQSGLLFHTSIPDALSLLRFRMTSHWYFHYTLFPEIFPSNFTITCGEPKELRVWPCESTKSHLWPPCSVNEFIFLGEMIHRCHHMGHVTSLVSSCPFEVFFYMKLMFYQEKNAALFVHSIGFSVSSARQAEGHSFMQARTKATASQIALFIQSQRTLFIHYLFSGSAIVAGHCEEG